MTLIQGIAIVGKRNEPLYLCDCAKLLSLADATSDDPALSKNEAPPPSAGGSDGTTSNNINDPFGFLQASVCHRAGQSLELAQQFVLHAALDALEEYVGASHPDGTMPLRKVTRNNAMNNKRTTSTSTSNKGKKSNTKNNPSGLYLGRLIAPDESTAVYGYVTATNIKFLILLDMNGSAVTEKQEDAIHRLCTTLHSHYISYWMNPFQSLDGLLMEDGGTSPILDSVTFDKNMRQAVQDFREAVEKASSN
jgi:hypothetical protein